MASTTSSPHAAPSHSSDYLSINAGSSSIKFALYRCGGPAEALTRLLEGGIAGIGSEHASFSVRMAAGDAIDDLERHFPIPERVTAVNVLADWLAEHIDPDRLHAVAHRVVHGGHGQRAAEHIGPDLLAALYEAVTGEPEHLPQQIHLIEILQRRFPNAMHVACDDSAFHAGMASEAAMLPLPHRYYSAGVRRYGYHGLSCAWMMHELAQLAGPEAAAGKVVLAHLGGGASITAVSGGIGRDTSMGLTPASGIVMGKRSGDLDPGLAWHCARHEQMTPAQFNHMVNHEAGMLGVSGRSADLRVLLEHAAHDSRCADAVALFLYQARKTICAMTGAIGGIDTLVFSGGIGENAAVVRARLCAGLAHLGVTLDSERNALHAPVISGADSAVTVRVIRSDEQWMMARLASQLLASPGAAHG